MKRALLFLLVLCAWHSSLHAQISIDTITTDTINIFDQARITAPASSAAALWITPLIPGAGHQIASRPKRALAFISLDVLSLCGALALHHYAQKATQNAQAVAYLHAGIQNSSTDEYFWQIVGNFDSYEDYHRAYPTDFREFSDKFSEEKYYWEWDQKETVRKEYNTFRKESKRMSTLSAFFVGAMFLNRLVAFIDLRTSLNNQRFTSAPPSVTFSPVSGHSGSGLMLTTTF